LTRRTLSLLLQVSQCFSMPDGPVTAPASILPVVPWCGVSSVVISSRRGYSLPGRGTGCKVCGLALLPAPRAGSRLGVP
jgi:hypothetical protein